MLNLYGILGRCNRLSYRKLDEYIFENYSCFVLRALPNARAREREKINSMMTVLAMAIGELLQRICKASQSFNIEKI